MKSCALKHLHVPLMAVVLSVFAAASAQAGGTPARINSLVKPAPVSGEWKIMIGDDMRFAGRECDDSSWDTLRLPGAIRPYIREKNGPETGVVWIRKSVFIGSGLPREDIGLILGRIGDADQTFFNGEKIGGMGEFPPGEHSMWNHPRHYLVPRALVRYGEQNVIAVRISYFVYAEVLGTLAIADLQDWKNNKTFSNFFLITLSYVFLATGIPILMIFIFFMIQRHKPIKYFFYCIQLVCTGFIILDSSGYLDIYGDTVTRMKVFMIAWAVVIVLHQRFVHEIYRMKRKIVERMYLFYLVAVLAAALLFVDASNLRLYGLAFAAVSLITGLYSVACQIEAHLRFRPCLEFFSFFEALVLAGALHDGVVYIIKFAGLDTGVPLLQYVMFQYVVAVLFVGIAMLMVARLVGMMGEMKQLSERLEDSIAENAMLNRCLGQSNGSPNKAADQAVNDRNEGKIQQVIRYIQENYMYDLSREGLAAAVDMHPDNLGRLFKIIVNRKMGEYINELRINDAAAKLLETSENIINIAYSVGFDSLRTFNRVFLKTMQMTPEQYRKVNSQEESLIESFQSPPCADET
jgi:AraC-like DNA-binding protein